MNTDSATQEKKVPATVYAETTPNPAAIKFVANKVLVPYGATVEYKNPEECSEAPLARVLFSFPFVESVFMSSNFVSITKKDFIEWDEIVRELRDYLTNYLQAGQPIFHKPPTKTQHVTHKEDGSTEQIKLTATPENEREEKIVNILEEYVRPAVESDGGAIHFKSFDNGTLTVRLSGACSGCPSSSQTLKGGIENIFKKFMPEVQEVVAEEV